jgi:ribonuclease-3
MPIPRILALLDQEILDSDWFAKAITHRSASKKNNERLEFLGDSVLSMVIANYLFERFPNANEGDLSRLRSHLVRGATLAKIASESNLGDYLKLGAGELKSGGFRRESIMEDALEAIIGAAFLLKGFEYARDYILAVFAAHLENLPQPETLKDPKSRLQEWLQSRSMSVPAYQVLEISGEAHNQTFTAECRIENPVVTTQAMGSSRRKAEQAAAAQALEIILQESS